jgi:predicted amino acid-binding ACT domain protein
MATIKKQLDKIGKEMKLAITIQDQNIFKTMHRV